jgi:hypothetical protein
VGDLSQERRVLRSVFGVESFMLSLTLEDDNCLVLGFDKTHETK